jgi:tetratricopeptide (TPR) repeat protein
MIERIYMGVDGRRDHSFRIPRPDLSDETGAPNACIDCHADRDNAWAAAEIAARFPSSPRRGPHFSQTYAAFRADPEAASLALIETAESTEAASIVRATALEMLRGVATPEIAGRAAALLEHPDPLIRATAVGVQRGAQPIDRVQRLIPFLADPVRTVRVAAARELTGAPIARLPPATERILRSASAEWRATLIAKTDYPETHLVIGGLALTLRNLRAAEAAFREAVQLDPQLTDAWAMIVRIRDAVGDANGARDALSAALDANPTSLPLLQLDQALDD